MFAESRRLEFPDHTFEEIVEGDTRILVPKGSITDIVPPKKPAFFNPKAKINRDFSMVAYAAFWRSFEGPKVFLEGLGGTGARGLRVSNELEAESIIINDLNPTALEMARESARRNGIKNVEFSEREVCRFLSEHSRKGSRGSIVDVDPFGSPAAYFDCAIRATMHGGMLSSAATDLQVLNGLWQSACKRRYGGVPIRVEYGDEIAIRLVLGCLRTVAARLGVKIDPLFVESEMHYYRTYVRILNRPDLEENIGYVLHCKSCGHRKISPKLMQECEMCGSSIDVAGPLWIGKIFDAGFLQAMLDEIPDLNIDKSCKRTIEKGLAEAGLAGTYFTVDEIASKTKSSPPKLENVIRGLERSGFSASLTAFNPTGFRTDADISHIAKVFESIR